MVLFKFKGIMAFPMEQRETGQESQAVLELSHRTFYLHALEAPGTVEVSIAASTAQGGILIADAAPRKLLILSLKPGSHSLGLQEHRGMQEVKYLPGRKEGWGKSGAVNLGLFLPQALPCRVGPWVGELAPQGC